MSSSDNQVATTTTRYQCRALAKTTGKRCLKNTDGDVCGTHRTAQFSYPKLEVQQDPAAIKKEYPVTVQETEFNKKPIFSIRHGKFFFNFGLKKAKAMLENIDAIRHFVNEGLVETSSLVRVSEFKGFPVLSLHSSSGDILFSAGAVKYSQILANLPELEAWYAKHGTPSAPVQIIVTKESLGTVFPPEQVEAMFALLSKASSN